MPGDRSPVVAAVVFSLPAALVFQLADAQTVAGNTDEPAQVVITGTRVQNRSALETAVPIDVLPADLFRNRGVPEISQALADALPSYNFPRPGLSDATDTVRPATLRGLSPDETLVLVNGKRRQSAALVNINGTIGRGASAVDLNTIPQAMVKSVEGPVIGSQRLPDSRSRIQEPGTHRARRLRRAPGEVVWLGRLPGPQRPLGRLLRPLELRLLSGA